MMLTKKDAGDVKEELEVWSNDGAKKIEVNN